MRNGIWSEDEHDRFLLAIKESPKGPWSVIAQAVGTRSVRQVQTHTQKYYEKILRRMRGLRKDRKTWARVEHRIDGDILAFCELMKGKKSLVTSTSAPTPAQVAIANEAASPPRSGGSTSASSCASISPTNSPRKSSSLYSSGSDLTNVKAEIFAGTCTDWCVETPTQPLPTVVMEPELEPLGADTMHLPPLEEALDFFIQAME